MKHILWLILVGYAAAVARAETEASFDGPRLVFEGVKYDFGEVDPGKLIHEFKFKNAGNKTLEIQRVQPGCGCTVSQVTVEGKQSSVTPYKVEPGQSGSIRAELDASRFKGSISKGITVVSTDPVTPNVNLLMTATVKVELMVYPQPNVVWPRLTVDTLTNATVEIRSQLPAPLVVEKIESSVPWLEAKVVSSDAKVAKIEIATKPPLPMGQNYGIIKAHTSYEKYKTVQITVDAGVPATITVVPSRLFFLASRAKGPVDISLLVMRNDGKDFQITDVDVGSQFLSTHLTTNQPGRQYRLTVRYEAKNGEKPANSKLVIKTDEPSWPKVEVPVVFR